ncbi:hypothetical protein [Rubrivirga sp. IMCC45206]|uniref:hypothetical protein n=1 Tax=Rubrivirga sp. IMCC45206 TaxID=3391614 RepID=UPI00398F93B1
MPRLIAFLLLLAMSASAEAQSEWVPTDWAVAGTASYAGAVYVDRDRNLEDLRGPSASIDATWKRLSVGAAVASFPDDTVTLVGGAFHLARNLKQQVVSSIGVAFQTAENSDDYLIPTFTHSRRLSGVPDAALIGSLAVGGAVPTTPGPRNDIALTATGALSWLTDRGPVRTVVSPSVGVALSQVSSASVGVTLGLALGGD